MTSRRYINLAGLMNIIIRASILATILILSICNNNLVYSQLNDDSQSSSLGSLFSLVSSNNNNNNNNDGSPIEIDSDGFTIDASLSDSLADELFAKEELLKDEEEVHKSQSGGGTSASSSSSTTTTTTGNDQHNHLFDKICPYGFFQCSNGECISPKWRCDGHYDCDDYSDELNCTNVDQLALDINKSNIDKLIVTPTKPSASSSAVNHDELLDITFNSTEEPLMLFSTGLSIRGLWMKRRVYFDVVSMGVRPAKVETPSITQALSVFFDLFNIERPAGSSSKPQDQDSSFSDGSPSSSSGGASSSSSSSSSSSKTTTFKSRSTIVGVDMDPDNKEVFWVELGKNAGIFSTTIENEQFESRHRRQFNVKNKPIVDSGLLAPEDIALDTIGKNIYVTDAGLPAIVVCSIKHSHCRIIVKDNLHKPRAIIADSSTGWLTYTDWGDNPGIYLVTMDGKRRETLIDTEVVWPNGLASDYSTNHLYWADARLSKIERIDLATKARKVIIQENPSNPFSLSLFENRIYWSDWSGNEIKTCDKNNGNNTKILMHTENIYGIHIYHPNIYSSQVGNPCWSKHCTHICLISPTASALSSQSFVNRKVGSITGTCACPDSMALSVKDKATCYEIHLSFLLINVKNYIAQVFPDRIGLHVIEKVIYSKEHIIHDVASDWLHYRLFFFDAAKQHIYLADLYDKNFKIQSFIQTSQSVRGLLYDSWSDNLYWLDSDRGTMTMCSVKSKFELIIRKDLERPISMVLDSRQRVFYIAMLGSTPHILRTDILGNEQSDMILIGNDIGLPVALHLDEKLQRLYWADARRETIESLDLDIKSQTNGIKPNSRIIHRRKLGTILAFTVYQEHFLWTIKNGDYLYKAKIQTISNNNNPLDSRKLIINNNQQETRPVTFKLPPNPSAKDPSSDNKRIILVDPKNEISNLASPCHKRGCSHGCVLDSNNLAHCFCPEAFKLQASNKTNCIPASEHQDCGPKMFKCLDTSHCILNSWKCDGTRDCDDGSDERDCNLQKPECPKGDFACKNGHCISSSWRCDSTNDCQDNSDEENCPKKVVDNACTVGYFACGDGKCIPQLWRCDRERDCSNGNDEHDCRTEECKPNFFRCKDNSCIPHSWLCDKSQDCPGGEDEKNCAESLCKSNEQFLCDNQMCIDIKLKCDGRKDCVDGSDELNCTIAKSCPQNMITCASDHHCIYQNDICDGHQDCEDGSDEHNCTKYRSCASYEIACDSPKPTAGSSTFFSSSSSSSPSTRTNGGSSNNSSKQDHHHQQQHRKCIPKAWLCDGQDDCGDWSDEINEKCLPPSYDHMVTTTSKPCHDGSFPCYSGECIKWNQVCDQEDNCLDGSDEGGKCLVSCSINNGGCAQQCRSSPLGPSCTCYDGYVMSNDTKTCEDVDECSHNGICSQYCYNFKGGYKCSCGEGYMLAKDKRHCKAIGDEEPFVLFMLPNEILSFGIINYEERVITTSESVDISGLDFDYENNQVIWSESSKGQILSKMLRQNNSDKKNQKQSFININMNTNNNNNNNNHNKESEKIDIVNEQESKKIVQINDLDQPKNLAFDWIARNIYFTQSRGTTHVCNFDSKKCSILFDGRISNCNSLAVAPTVGYMFWVISSAGSTGNDFKSGIIERAEMDGTNRKLIVGDKIHSPIGLTIDYVLERIYWTDLKVDEISSVDFAGRGRQIILAYSLQNPAGLALFEDSLFISNIGSDSLMRCNKFSGLARITLKNGGVKSNVLRVFHQVNQPKTNLINSKNSHQNGFGLLSFDLNSQHFHKNDNNPCFNTSCTHICALSNSSTYGYGCICPDGQVLGDDQHSCIPWILADSASSRSSQPSKVVWVFILLIPLSLAAIVVISLFLYRQGRLPSQLSVSFVSYDKDAMLLLDDA